MAKVVFIGGIWMNSDEKKEIELSKGNVQIAANVFQRSIIEGIEECLSNPVTVVNEKIKKHRSQIYRLRHLHSNIY